MTDTRSAVLGRHKSSGTNSNTLLATVPAGEVWLVKGVIVFNDSAAANGFQLYLQDLPSSSLGRLFNESLGAQTGKVLTCWAVADAGCTLNFFAQFAGCEIWVSGSRLISAP